MYPIVSNRQQNNEWGDKAVAATRCYPKNAHGHSVDPDVGLAIAKALKAQRVRLPDRDERVLLRWAERPYGF